MKCSFIGWCAKKQRSKEKTPNHKPHFKYLFVGMEFHIDEELNSAYDFRFGNTYHFIRCCFFHSMHYKALNNTFDIIEISRNYYSWTGTHYNVYVR